MKRYIFLLLAACLLTSSPALAEGNNNTVKVNTENNTTNKTEENLNNKSKEEKEEKEIKGYFVGEIDISYQLSHIKGSKAKANEYSSRGQGPLLRGKFDWAKGLHTMKLDAEYSGNFSSHKNIGFDRHSFNIDGEYKKLDHYKFRGFAQKFTHHLSDGKTNKDGGPTSKSYLRSNTSLSDFTYHKKRVNTGLEVEVSADSPFFAGIKLDNQRVSGLMPLYHVDFSSNGNFPFVTNYDVTTFAGEFGYRENNFIAKLDASFDKLQNNENTHVRRGKSYVPGGPFQGFHGEPSYRKRTPESENYKLGGSLMWRMPEIKSSFMMNASFANLTSDWADSSADYENATAGYGWDRYKGDIKNTNINANFTTQPFKGFSAKIYTRYHSRDNDSKVRRNKERDAKLASKSQFALLREEARDKMAFYSFDKFLIGSELSQRIGTGHKVTAGYEHENIERNRYGITKVSRTEDNRFWLQLDTDLTEKLNASLRYDFMDRESTRTKGYDIGIEHIASGMYHGPSSGLIAPWFSYADSASKRQHKIKTALDYNIIEDLNLGLEYTFTYDDFTKKQRLGMDSSTKHGVLGDISYSLGRVRLSGYGGLEYGNTKMDTRSFSVFTPNPGLPNDLDNDVYNWNYKQRDTTYSLGANAVVDIIKDKLEFTLSYDYIRNSGKTKISSPIDRADIKPVDKYTLHEAQAKFDYHVTENHSVGLGYAYTKLDYKDWAYENVSSKDKLSDGYYNASPSFEAHTIAITGSYDF